MTGRAAPRMNSRPEWLRRKERGSVFALRTAVSLALMFGRRFARLFLPLGCLYFLAFAPAARRASARYLTRALNRPASLANVFRHFHAFASCVLDRAFFLADRTDDLDIRIFGEDELLTL